MSESKTIAPHVNNLGRFKQADESEKRPTRVAQHPTPPAPVQQKDAEFEAEPRVKKLNHENILDHLQEIPQVHGFRVLLIPVEHNELTAGGIALPAEVIERQRNHAQVFRVVGMGSQAYKDPDRFPDGPYCEIGDYVYIGRYAGTKITTLYCDELRVLNDDEIMASVPLDVEDTLTFV